MTPFLCYLEQIFVLSLVYKMHPTAGHIIIVSHWCKKFHHDQFCVCRIDVNFVIKVADFGLSESIESKDYFRQNQEAAVKLPIKWMAPESICDGVFTEKSDVVRWIAMFGACHYQGFYQNLEHIHCAYSILS